MGDFICRFFFLVKQHSPHPVIMCNVQLSAPTVNLEECKGSTILCLQKSSTMLTTAALQLTSQNLWSAALNVWHLTPPSSYLLASSDLSQRDRTQVLALAMASCLFRLGAARADRLLREREYFANILRQRWGRAEIYCSINICLYQEIFEPDKLEFTQKVHVRYCVR